MKSIILILGDRLDKNISSLQSCDKQKDIIMMCPLFLKRSSAKLKRTTQAETERIFSVILAIFMIFCQRGKGN